MNSLYVETACRQASCHNEAPCGDNFIQQQFPAAGHTVLALSDGMGHGIKAHLLSSLTSAIFMGMAGAEESLEETARTVMQALPVCSVRQISYSTFTLVDIDHRSGHVRLIEYDNPAAFIFRDDRLYDPERETIPYDDPQSGRTRMLGISRFEMRRGDRIVIVTDGVTQSGVGSDRYPFGWKREKVADFLGELLGREPGVTTSTLAGRLLDRAVANDDGVPKDDISCVAIHVREPRQALLCSCPPSITADIARVAEALRGFEGSRIVCGHLLASQIAGHWHTELRRQLTSTDPELPPQWEIDGLDLVTEGLLTLSKVLEILENYAEMPTGRGPAYHICELLLAADHIQIIIGMRKSNATTEDAESLILRRKTLGQISRLLEYKFAKQVTVTYL